MGLFSSLFGKKDATQLAAVIAAGAFLVDVRTPEEFLAGSVKGAVNIPLDQLQGRLAAFKNKNAIVVFCRSGGRSSMAKRLLTQNGFDNVINGGSWQQVNRIRSQK
ncbi:rhodanese-like domain-containing protein [Niabella drilacis]|uniref:Rhodanese-related sulfurtransferase n=1 Tax=Niabella drilacis (strain DSM 25811 / CCM 8410 / CCUG 62505 / LMG 26954 / E90) TaxID=1285928 RepID=A0A1G6RH22_NIADE|nr:rhodanese-like domain-containing protein [Niabella drilacis]SDD03307.1 Rhodanese-related sulfurtransferase [Niabella drilacis]